MKFAKTMKMAERKRNIENTKGLLAAGILTGVITPRLNLSKGGYAVALLVTTTFSALALRSLEKATK